MTSTSRLQPDGTYIFFLGRLSRRQFESFFFLDFDEICSVEKKKRSHQQIIVTERGHIRHITHKYHSYNLN